MHRTVNLRLLAVLAVVVIIILAGVYLLHAGQVSRQAGLLLQEADQAAAEKDLPRSRDYLERYLRLKPTDGVVLRRYALLLDQTARGQSEKIRAYLTLEDALRAAPGDAELTHRAAERALSLPRYREAKQHLQTLLITKPEDAELLELLARAEVGLGEMEAAQKDYQKVIAKAPSHVASYVALAALHVQNRRFDEADAVLRGMVEANPNSTEARLERCNYLRQRRQFAEAAKELEAARRFAQGDRASADVLLASGELASSMGNQDEARLHYSRGVVQFPKDVRFFVAQAQLELSRGPKGRPAAIDLLRRAVPLAADGMNEQWMIAKLFLDAGDKVRAEQLTAALREKLGPIPVLEYIRARLLCDEGKIGEGLTILERIRGELARVPSLNVEVNLRMAVAYEMMGNQDGRLAALDRVLRVSPSTPEILLARADALTAVGRISEAQAICRPLANQYPAARYRLIRLLVTMEQQKPEERRNWAEVNDLLNRCPPAEKQTRDYILTSFLILWAQGKTEELGRAAEIACREHPEEVAYWLSRIAYLEKRYAKDVVKQRAAVTQCLGEAEKSAGERIELRLVRARLLTEQPADVALAGLEQLRRDVGKLKPDDQVAMLTLLADSFRRFGRTTEARQALSAAAGLAPLNLPVLVRQIELADSAKDVNEVQRLLKELRAREGEEGVAWRLVTLNQQIARAEGGDLGGVSEARRLLQELAERRPNWHRLYTAQGRLLELERRPDLALEKYVRAIELGERSPAVLKKAIQQLVLRRRHDEARQLVNASLSDLTDTSLYARLASIVTLATQPNPAEALGLAEGAVRADSTDFEDYLWLGNFRWVAGDRTGAEAALRKAVTLGPKEPQTWARLANFLVDTNRKDEAAAEINRAGAALGEKLPYALIPYYEALDQRDKAEEEYFKLLQRTPNDAALLENLVMFYLRGSNPTKAEQHLKALAQFTGSDAAAAAWARRLYALLLSGKGDAESYRQALAAVEQNLRGEYPDPQDLRVRALLQASRPGMRREVIADLEKAFSLVTPSPTETLVLARFYEENGQWGRASASLLRLVGSKEGEAPYALAYVVRALIRNQHAEQAVPWMEKLEAKAPKDPATVDAKVRLLVALGRSSEAVTLLESHATAWYQEHKDPHVYLTAMQLLENVGQPAAAEAQLRKYVTAASTSNPADCVLQQAAFFARHGRASEGLLLCEAGWDKLPVGDGAQGLLGIASAGSLNEREAGRVEKRLLSSHQAHPEDLKVSLALADFYHLQGKGAEAVALYASILEKNPKHPVVLNNLAWLLGQADDTLLRALRLINEAIDLAGADGGLLDTRGIIEVRKRNYSDAINDLTEAVAQSPRPARWMHLALAQYRAGNPSEAQRSWTKAKKAGLNPAALSHVEKAWYQELAGVLTK